MLLSCLIRVRVYCDFARLARFDFSKYRDGVRTAAVKDVVPLCAPITRTGCPAIVQKRHEVRFTACATDDLVSVLTKPGDLVRLAFLGEGGGVTGHLVAVS